MGYQVIAQPEEGQYAVFSSVTDGIVMWNATREEVAEFFREIAVEQFQRIMLRVDDPYVKAYYQFTLTWEEALAEHEENHGPLKADDEEPSDG